MHDRLDFVVALSSEPAVDFVSALSAEQGCDVCQELHAAVDELICACCAAAVCPDCARLRTDACWACRVCFERNPARIFPTPMHVATGPLAPRARLAAAARAARAYLVGLLLACWSSARKFTTRATQRSTEPRLRMQQQRARLRSALGGMTPRASAVVARMSVLAAHTRASSVQVRRLVQVSSQRSAQKSRQLALASSQHASQLALTSWQGARRFALAVWRRASQLTLMSWQGASRLALAASRGASRFVLAVWRRASQLTLTSWQGARRFVLAAWRRTSQLALTSWQGASRFAVASWRRASQLARSSWQVASRFALLVWRRAGLLALAAWRRASLLAAWSRRYGVEASWRAYQLSLNVAARCVEALARARSASRRAVVAMSRAVARAYEHARWALVQAWIGVRALPVRHHATAALLAALVLVAVARAEHRDS